MKFRPKQRSELAAARDKDGNIVQTASLDTANAQRDVTLATQIDAEASRVCIISGSADANIQIESETFAHAAGQGLFFIGGYMMTVEIPAGWWIASDVAIQVCPFGLGE